MIVAVARYMHSRARAVSQYRMPVRKVNINGLAAKTNKTEGRGTFETLRFDKTRTKYYAAGSFDPPAA